ncbi:hypothetical protein PR001_g29375 [Phytophthora rubi]|uniref:ARS-binding protein 1 N-terminal domain-containing protein n=1 Tax=Phytophthora rubi TaxID=129364 RepID=A0A6A3H2G1_9STRA|nr:hypothetical protein PR001_g29375 [Phytophthora rubi]
MPRHRVHMTLGEKNELWRHGQIHPNLTCNQLVEWAFGKYGKLPSASGISLIMTTEAVPTPLNPNAKRTQLGQLPAMDVVLFQAIAARAESLGVDVKVLVQDHDPMLDNTAIWKKANSILRRTRNDGSCVQPTWNRSFKQ